MKNLTAFSLTLTVVVQRQGEVLPSAAEVATRIENYLPGLSGGNGERAWFVNAVKTTKVEELPL